MGNEQSNLKICFDTCGSIDEDAVLESLLTKKPVVIIENLNTSGTLNPKYVDTTSTSYNHDENRSQSQQRQDDITPSQSFKSRDGQYKGSWSELKQTRDNVPFMLSRKQSSELHRLSDEMKISPEVIFWDISDVLPVSYTHLTLPTIYSV